MKLEAFAAQHNNEAPQSVIMYGPPKAGKTTLAAQLARKYKIIWFDIEKGAQTLLTALPEEYWQNLEIFCVDDSQNIPNGIKTVGKVVSKNATHVICDAHGVVQCMECSKAKAPMSQINLYNLSTEYVVVFDSLTQLSDSAMAHAVGPLDEFEKKKLEYDHYDRQGLLLKNILTAQARLPCHRIFISHEEELEQEDGKKKLCPVGGTRNFSRKVARYFDHVIYCEVKNMKHVANSSSTASMKFNSGSRNNRTLEKSDSILDIFTAKPLELDAVKIAAPTGIAGAGKAASNNPILQKLAAQGKLKQQADAAKAEGSDNSDKSGT